MSNFKSKQIGTRQLYDLIARYFESIRVIVAFLFLTQINSSAKWRHSIAEPDKNLIYFKHTSSLIKAPPHIGNSIKHRPSDSKQFEYLIKWAVAYQ